MTVQKDILNRYLFDDLHVRGELVQLETSYQKIISPHHYPEGVKQLLGELVAATCLLTATLKIKGEIVVQLQGNGPIGYLAVNGDHQQNMRGIARVNQASEAFGLRNLIGKGNMVITIRPANGEPYQGIVALEQDTLAGCLAHYFDVSEQIPTRFWLFYDDKSQQAAGCLIQLLPDSGNKAQQLTDFEHLCQLTETIKTQEIMTLDAKNLLYRLYHQENVRLFEPQKVNCQCSCSQEKCLAAISQIAPSELSSIISEQGKVSMTCDYCLTTYDFFEQQLAVFMQDLQH